MSILEPSQFQEVLRNRIRQKGLQLSIVRRRVVDIQKVIDSIQERHPWQIVRFIVQVFGYVECSGTVQIVGLRQTEHVTDELGSRVNRELL